MTEDPCAASRRAVVAMGGAAVLAALIAPCFALADTAAVDAELRKQFGDKAMDEGKIKLDLPQIAENGLVVPITVEVESPMTEADHVTAVHVFADGNPAPRVVSYYFSPANGKAAASTRMRLAQSQTVIAVAEMSNGNLHVAKAPVKVTIGGCGG
jgi:sulfur-oxidizing protein SoxY